MGDVEENIAAVCPHVRGGTFRGFNYQVGRSSPAMHLSSPEPDMNAAQKAAVVAASTGTEQQWLDAHPTHIKTWLQAQPANIRASCKLGAQYA